MTLKKTSLIEFGGKKFQFDETYVIKICMFIQDRCHITNYMIYYS